MYIKPQEYLQELKNRIDELKAELAELEPIYQAIKDAGIKSEQSLEPVVYREDIRHRENMTPAQKIAESQKERHRRERDKKVPGVIKYIKKNGASSLAAIGRDMNMTSAAVKRIVEENPRIFAKNNNQLWYLRN